MRLNAFATVKGFVNHNVMASFVCGINECTIVPERQMDDCFDGKKKDSYSRTLLSTKT